MNQIDPQTIRIFPVPISHTQLKKVTMRQRGQSLSYNWPVNAGYGFGSLKSAQNKTMGPTGEAGTLSDTKIHFIYKAG